MDLGHSLADGSLTGLPSRPRLEFQAAGLAVATCPPPCGLLSQRILLMPSGLPPQETPHGLVHHLVEICECRQGHRWPYINVSPGEEG